jgi:acyl carrier protein phosphodiesterase
MNYLAHAYLSFGDAAILTGNMISDYIKGKKQFDYPAAIQQGIQLHRAIDQFTDDHEATKAIKRLFSPYVRLYAGAFADIVYDHFLALDEKTADEWLVFSSQTYLQLNEYKDWFPPPFARLFPYMTQQNWLYNYRFEWGIQNSFRGLERRAQYLGNTDAIFACFLKEYDTIKQLSAVFLPDVKKFAFGQFQERLRQ